MISVEQFAEWKEHPVTKEIFADLKKMRESIKDQLVDGNTIGDTADVTHGITNRVIGQLDGIDQLLNISYIDEDSQEEVNDQSGY